MAYLWHSCDSPNCTWQPFIGAKQRFNLSIILVAILVFAILEWLAGNLSHSLALRSDAWHMLADGGAIMLALSASWLARLTIRSKLPGNPRFDVMAALFNGLGLLLMAGLIAWEAIEHLIQPPEQILSGPMLVTAIIGLVINLVGAWLLHGDIQDNLNVRGAFLHMLADLASSVGVIISAIAVYVFQCFWLDGVVSILIALFITKSAVPLIQTSWQQWKQRSAPLQNLQISEIGRTSLKDLIVEKSE
ncbi:MAG: cation diffusion facilitator family transporter [Calothrix sp. MO_167.B12]|nr:cation diffusion facilitator family transporter [Calothrix sp. MO_167.B12]